MNPAIFQAPATTSTASVSGHDLVDEYRLLVFPLVLGTGERLFPDGTPPIDLTLLSAQTAGSAVRLIYTRPGNQPAAGEDRVQSTYAILASGR